MAMKLWGARAPGNAQEIRDAKHMKNKKKASISASAYNTAYDDVMVVT